MALSEILFIHIGLGTISVLSGFAALFLEKGSRPHRMAGNIFFVSMLIMSAAGAYIAHQKPVAIAFLAGIFAIYLVTTSWMTVKRAERTTGLPEKSALIVVLAISVSGLVFGLGALNSESGLKDGFSEEPYFFFGALALFAAALDVSVILRGGVAGRQRIARHLWRMCFALFIAAGSAFTGPGATAFPEIVQGSLLLSVPENLALLLMIFWLFRTALAKNHQQGGA